MLFLALPWSTLVGLPAAALALVGLLAGLGRLIVLALRRDRSSEALRIAIEVQQQQQALIAAQHETNVDIDKRLKASTIARATLDHELATQRSRIQNLEQGRALQDHRLAKIEAERNSLRQRLDRILAWLAASGIVLPDDLKHEGLPAALQDNPPPTP